MSSKSSDTKVDIGFTSAEWKPEYLASAIGAKISIGSYDFYSTNLSVTAVGNGTPAGTSDTAVNITIPEVPTDKVIHIATDSGYITIPATATTVDIKPYGYKNGTCVSIVMMLKKDGKRVGISATSTPVIGELTLSSPIFSGTQGEIGKAEYVFPAFQFDGNFTQNFTNDATFELKGSAIASVSSICGNADEYGYYQEYITADTTLSSFTSIVATPTTVELDLSDVEKQQIAVYGIKNDLYDRVLIANNSSKLTYVSATPAKATVDATGLITPIAVGSSVITVTYDGKNVATMTVTVIA